MHFFNQETSIIDYGATIGEGTKIWHWSHICGAAVIGKNCILGQNVYVASGVIIGNGVKIQNNVSVYEGVIIEDDVFCGPGMVFTNVYNPRAFIERKMEFRQTLVKRGATLGGNCTIVCGISIGEYAFIGAGAVINEDVPDFALYAGVPGKHIGWMTKYGKQMSFSPGECSLYECPDTGDKYVFDGVAVRLSANQ